MGTRNRKPTAVLANACNFDLGKSFSYINELQLAVQLARADRHFHNHPTAAPPRPFVLKIVGNLMNRRFSRLAGDLP